MPMSDKVHQVIARALIDPSFRDSLAANPEQTLKIAAPGLTPAEIGAVANLRPQEWKNLSLGEVNARLGQVASWKVSTIES